jgi:hypothetical protein
MVSESAKIKTPQSGKGKIVDCLNAFFPDFPDYKAQKSGL